MAFVYIMTNPGYPGYVKIGSTGNVESNKTVEDRRKELSRPEGVMFPFEIYAYYEAPIDVPDKSVHDLIDAINPELRANKRREFYKMSPERAFVVLEAMAKMHNAQDKITLVGDMDVDSKVKKTKKSPFSFKSAGIPFGSQLSYSEDDDIKVTVISDGQKNIEYNGEKTSLSSLASKLLETNQPVQGTLYFLYEGETLHDRRTRMEQQGTYNN